MARHSPMLWSIIHLGLFLVKYFRKHSLCSYSYPFFDQIKGLWTSFWNPKANNCKSSEVNYLKVKRNVISLPLYWITSTPAMVLQENAHLMCQSQKRDLNCRCFWGGQHSLSYYLFLGNSFWHLLAHSLQNTKKHIKQLLSPRKS